MTKYRILQELKENQDKYISGEHLGSMLGISRTAIWKHINELKKEGYPVESSTKKGYKFSFASDILNTCEICSGLRTDFIGRNLLYFDKLDSTSTYARKIASEGCENGTVVAADEQTSGRGRLGREWASAPGKGIWLSVVLRPSAVPGDVLSITLAAAVAVVSALRTSTGIESGIKWPNDVLIGGRKVCGILTEMVSEIDRVDFIVLGIGINVNHDLTDFPYELRNTATSLRLCRQVRDECPSVVPASKLFRRSEIIAELLCELERVYYLIIAGRTPEIIAQWKRESVTIGRCVKFTARNTAYEGIAVDVTNDGKLIVNCEDGIVREISSGEISQN